MKVFPSVTTWSLNNLSWKDKLQEIRTFGISEFALFLTGLEKEERQHCYTLLEQLCRDQQFSIPFVHAVSDMHENEFWYLRDTYGTEKFNLHPTRFYPLQYTYSPMLREHLCIENSPPEHVLQPSDFAGFGGACIDLSHLEELRRFNAKDHEKNVAILNSVEVSANHISAVLETAKILDNRPSYSTHTYQSLHQFDYLASMPLQFFAPLIAIELENSIAEQLPVVNRVKNLLQDRVSALDLKKAA